MSQQDDVNVKPEVKAAVEKAQAEVKAMKEKAQAEAQDSKKELQSERVKKQAKSAVKKEAEELDPEAEKERVKLEHEEMLSVRQVERDEYNKDHLVEQSEPPVLARKPRPKDGNAQTFLHLPSAHDHHFDPKIGPRASKAVKPDENKKVESE